MCPDAYVHHRYHYALFTAFNFHHACMWGVHVGEAWNQGSRRDIYTCICAVHNVHNPKNLYSNHLKVRSLQQGVSFLELNTGCSHIHVYTCTCISVCGVHLYNYYIICKLPTICFL